MSDSGVRALVHQDTLDKPEEVKALVYAIKGLRFKGAKVCLGFRVFYSEHALSKLLELVPKELTDVIETKVYTIGEIKRLRNGYFEGGLVFVQQDDEGTLYVYDPDTDGKVSLSHLTQNVLEPIYQVQNIPLEQIRLNEDLKYRAEYSIDELAENIKAFGLLNPLVVYRDKKVYRLLAGYRRYYAIKKLGWTSVPALVLNLPPESQEVVSFVENFFRAQPTKDEYKRLIALFLERGKVSSLYEFAKIAGIKHKSTFVRLLIATGLDANVEGFKEEENPFAKLVSALLKPQKSEKPVLDIEQIKSVLNESLKDTKSEGVALIELDLALVRSLYSWLNAQNQADFEKRFQELIRFILGSKCLVALAGEQKEEELKALFGEQFVAIFPNSLNKVL